jgi:hypothetical protein
MDSAESGGWAGRPTGPQLCTELAPLDPHSVADERLPELLSAQARQAGYQQAQVWTVMAEMAQRDPMPNLPGRARWTAQEIFESAVDEIRAELRLTRRAARTELANAVAVAALPAVLAALRDGVIDRARALVFADACGPLSDPQAAQLVATLLPDAARITATWLAEKAQQVAMALDPGWAEHRYRQAVTDQRVIGYLNPDGSAVVTGQNLPADQAAAACARVDALADAAKRAGAAARIDHLRATLFLGLLNGRFHGMTEQAITAELLRQFPKPATEPDGHSADPTDDPPAAADDPPAAEPRTATAHWPAAQHAAPAEPAEPPAPGGPGAGDAADASRGDGCSDAADARRGSHLRIGLGTLLGLDDAPGKIAGWGAIPASVARTIAAGQRRCEWRFAILDHDGHLVFDGITRRRPTLIEPATVDPAPGPGGRARARGGIVELHVPVTMLTDPELANQHPQWPIEQDPAARFAGKRLRRRRQTLFQHCIFPACRRPATDCDLDHHHGYGHGGRTKEHNLGPGCKHDHLLKTSGGWRLARRGDNTFVWISPLGRKHVVETDPVAPPLPAPIPPSQAAHLFQPGDEPDPPPTFQPLDRRGRPVVVDSTAPPTLTESAVDPPPF